jgi:hypothetical protein
MALSRELRGNQCRVQSWGELLMLQDRMMRNVQRSESESYHRIAAGCSQGAMMRQLGGDGGRASPEGSICLGLGTRNHSERIGTTGKVPNGGRGLQKPVAFVSIVHIVNMSPPSLITIVCIRLYINLALQPLA